MPHTYPYTDVFGTPFRVQKGGDSFPDSDDGGWEFYTEECGCDGLIHAYICDDKTEAVQYWIARQRRLKAEQTLK